MRQRSEFWDLVNEILMQRTPQRTIRILRARDVGDEEIEVELQERYGLSKLQASQAIDRYWKATGEGEAS